MLQYNWHNLAKKRDTTDQTEDFAAHVVNNGNKVFIAWSLAYNFYLAGYRSPGETPPSETREDRQSSKDRTRRPPVRGCVWCEPATPQLANQNLHLVSSSF